MTFRDRMTANVGDTDPVWRYLLEKVSHTALLTLVLFVAGVRLVPASIVATVGYLLAGKAIWHATHTDAWSWRDLVFDGLVGSFVVAVAFASDSWTGAAIGLLCWCVAFLVLDNARWGSPS